MEITVTKTVTATTTDLLSGTDLNAIPEGGELRFVIVDDAGTSTLQVIGPSQPVTLNNIKAQKRTNGQPVLSDEPPQTLRVTQGGHFTFSITFGAGATTATLVCSYVGDAELLAELIAKMR